MYRLPRGGTAGTAKKHYTVTQEHSNAVTHLTAAIATPRSLVTRSLSEPTPSLAVLASAARASASRTRASSSRLSYKKSGPTTMVRIWKKVSSHWWLKIIHIYIYIYACVVYNRLSSYNQHIDTSGTVIKTSGAEKSCFNWWPHRCPTNSALQNRSTSLIKHVSPQNTKYPSWEARKRCSVVQLWD